MEHRYIDAGELLLVRRNTHLRIAGLAAFALVLSLMFFPGQALETDGKSLRCIRFISAPLIGRHEVPLWYPRVFLGGFLFLLLVTITMLIMGWRHSKTSQVS